MHQVIEDSPLFDPEWYAEKYPDVAMLDMSPLEHYLKFGVLLLRDPGPNFSTAFYLVEHPDVARVGRDPLWHYETNGRKEGRKIAPSGYHLPPQLPESPVPRLRADEPSSLAARVISFYLPQFHPIPENDEWWGEGFTEWTNVRPAKPQMARHHQPHIPGDLGYYDLRDTEIQRKQIELARQYGVDGFCFYFYWFAGRRLLETPVRNYLNDLSLDLPFMLCWANENWSRRWDGRDDDVLIAQQHTPADDIAFIEHVADYLRDPRYIRIEGNPVLLVYRPNLLPDPRATANRWRNWCRENGIGEIHLAYTQSFESNDPRDYGFDAAIEFPPNNTGVPDITRHSRPDPGFTGRIYDWSALVERSHAYAKPRYPLYRGVCPSWDNTARRGRNGTILLNSRPGQFARWTSNAMKDTRDRFERPDERLVFVNAWNEWAEGAHLEPDRLYGYAWLEALRVAHACAAEVTPVDIDDPSWAVLLEVTEPAGEVAAVFKACRALPGKHVVIVATLPEHEAWTRRECEASGHEFELVVLGGYLERGWLAATLPAVLATGADLIARVTPGCRQVLEPEVLDQTLVDLKTDPHLGVVMPSDQRCSAEASVAGQSRAIGERLGLASDEIAAADRWRGVSFVARAAALAPLACLAFSDEDQSPVSVSYEPELPIAVDRAVALSAVAAGRRVAAPGEAVVEDGGRPVVIVSHDAHPHGAQRLALSLARGYRDLGFDVHMIVLGLGRMLERFSEVATVHHVDLLADAPSRTRRLLDTLRARGATFALVNTTVSAPIIPVLRAAGFRSVSLVHELPTVLNDFGLQEHARIVAEEADEVVFPAALVQRGFEQFLGEPVGRATIRSQGLYLHNPHRSGSARDEVRKRLRKRMGLNEGTRLVIGVGFADHRKGIDLFLQAGRRVLSSEPDSVLVWVGNDGAPDLVSHGRELLAADGLDDRFVLTGLVENPQDYYSAADVFLLTSREDPFPSVVLEALDAGLPVVAFADVTGSEEVLKRDAGVLVPALDVHAMADEALELLADPARATRLAEAGRALIKREFRFIDYLFDLAALAGSPLPRVSVVVPNYNYAHHVVDRLGTIAAQTVPIYELIVLDDASTDDSVERIREFLADRVLNSTTLVNQHNSGSVFKQWRRGVETATGDLVWIAEADDLADPEFLSETLAAFHDPDVVMSYTQSRQMAGDGSILSEDYLDYVGDIDRERWTAPFTVGGIEEIATSLFVKNTIPNVSACVFRREALLRTLREHGDEINSYRIAGDWVTYLRLLEQGKIAFSPRSLNSHRRHQDSVTIAGFDMRQLHEIVRVQRDTIHRHDLDSDSVELSDRYAQSLYEQFGLASDAYPSYRDRPELADRRDPCDQSGE